MRKPNFLLVHTFTILAFPIYFTLVVLFEVWAFFALIIYAAILTKIVAGLKCPRCVNFACYDPRGFWSYFPMRCRSCGYSFIVKQLDKLEDSYTEIVPPVGPFALIHQNPGYKTATKIVIENSILMFGTVALTILLLVLLIFAGNVVPSPFVVFIWVVMLFANLYFNLNRKRQSDRQIKFTAIFSKVLILSHLCLGAVLFWLEYINLAVGMCLAAGAIYFIHKRPFKRTDEL